MDACAERWEEGHRLRWNLKQRESEVRELQEALSESHVRLFEERERFLALQSQNDALRLQEAEDRSRIHQLLALSQPVERGVEYSVHDGPQTMVTFPGSGGGAGGAAETASGGGAGGGSQGGRGVVTQTVYLPNANAESLLLALESLQARAKSQAEVARAHIAALLEDREARSQEAARERESHEAEVQALAQRLRHTEGSLQQLTKDYIRASKDKEAAELEREEAKMEVAKQQQHVARELIHAEERGDKHAKRERREWQSKMSDFVESFRKQVGRREEDLADMENVHSALVQNYEHRIAILEAMVAKLSKQKSELEERRSLDLAGFHEDVTHLRRQLHSLHRKAVTSERQGGRSLKDTTNQEW